jgi:hypothetical protein
VRRTFASLQIPNYRRYFAGQVVSLTGNWMQTVAEMWLVVQLTGSGVAVGLTAALQFLPIMVCSPTAWPSGGCSCSPSRSWRCPRSPSGA